MLHSLSSICVRKKPNIGRKKSTDYVTYLIGVDKDWKQCRNVVRVIEAIYFYSCFIQFLYTTRV